MFLTFSCQPLKPHLHASKNDFAKNPQFLTQTQKMFHFESTTDVTKISLEQWVAFEESYCSQSKAREAARRIREAQRGSTILGLYCLHLRTVPPLSKCQHVTMYDLTGNFLNQIPEDLGDLPNLKSLEIHNNGLRQIPAFEKYPKLEILGINGNQIRHIPASLRVRNVQVLDNNTFSNPQGRNRYRRHIRRQKLREFIRSWWPGAPECLLPWVDQETLLLSPKYGPMIRNYQFR